MFFFQLIVKKLLSQVVNGPEILNKYVGESEANIRKLFEEAEEEQQRLGTNSGLHIIIFDELDAICKQRGSSGSSTGVHDTVSINLTRYFFTFFLIIN